MKKGYNEYYHNFTMQFTAFKEDYIGCLAYILLLDGVDSLNDITRRQVKEIMKKNLYWYGVSGWRGSTDTEQSLGPDDIEQYNLCLERAEEIITKLFPKIFSKEILNQNK